VEWIGAAKAEFWKRLSQEDGSLDNDIARAGRNSGV
jgi:hypothetical protein